MRSILLIFFLFYFSSFAENTNPVIKREKYIDEVLFPTTRFHSNIEQLLEIGYRAFIVDSISQFENWDYENIRLFLDENPSVFIAFIQEGFNHYNGDKLFSIFANQMINFNQWFLPLCDTLIKQEKQILFFSDKTEELQLSSFDNLVYVNVGKYFPVITHQMFKKYSPSNLFTVFSYDPLIQVERTDSVFYSNTIVEAAVNYFKKTGKFPNFIFTNNPKDIEKIWSEIPFYFKIKISDDLGNPIKDVQYKNLIDVTSSGVSHFYLNKIIFDSLGRFRENLEIIPVKQGYRFIPEIFTFNFNNFNQFKHIKAQRVSLDPGLILNMPLIKNRVFDKDYPIDVVESNIRFSNDEDRKNVATFDGNINSIYFNTHLINDSEESMSLGLWIKPRKIEGNYPIFSKSGSYSFKIRKGVLCFTSVDSVDVESKFSHLKSDEWQHIAITYEKGGKIYYYINGQLTDILQAPDYKLAESGFIIGANQWDEYFDGMMSDLLFWNRSIGSDDVYDIYAKGYIPQNVSSFIKLYKHLFGLIVIFLFTLSVIFFFWKRKRQRKEQISSFQDLTICQTEKNKLIECFGSFSIFDEQGNNLADRISQKKLSFLLVILHYTYKEGGISPQKLADIFWPGYDQNRAKNVRGTYIQEIRAIIDKQIMTVKYKNKTWNISLHPSFTCDLQSYISMQNIFGQTLAQTLAQTDHLDLQLLNSFLLIIEKGRFAEELNSPYIDNLKQQINDQILEILEIFLAKMNLFDNELLLRICKATCKHDPIHELAYKISIRLLNQQGKTSMAKKYFEKFVQSWKDHLGEDYPLDFEEFIKNG